MKTVLCTLEIVYGRQTKNDNKRSPCHNVTGELKNKSKILLTRFQEL